MTQDNRITAADLDAYEARKAAPTPPQEARTVEAGELLPCPFCGSRPYFTPDDSYGSCFVGCNCEPEPCAQARADEPEKALAAWNTRTQPTQLPYCRRTAEAAWRDGHGMGRCGGNLSTEDDDWKRSDTFRALATPVEAAEPDTTASGTTNDAVERAIAWLRQCSDWLLAKDLDMECPMQVDPLDLADDLAALSATPRSNDAEGDAAGDVEREIARIIRDWRAGNAGEDGPLDTARLIIAAMPQAEREWPKDAQFPFGATVQKKGRASWRGRIVGWYRTDLTALGYAVESAFEPGSVQIYPETTLIEWSQSDDRPAQSSALGRTP